MSIDQETLERRIKQLPSLSPTVIQILELFDKGDLEIVTLEKLISQDQGLTSRVLRMANSPFFGFSNTINNVKSACVVLGLQAIYNIVAATAVMERFPPHKGGRFDRYSFSSLNARVETPT